ncbi:EamA family transporter [Avrilella dinanensis]|uniref:EamA family transporter n=1 Tax=Avrilella dinanensis TaxID=2008672 RepID=UPI00240A5CF8|nr:EamA family transporter [Avrilella dinanensis]
MSQKNYYIAGLMSFAIWGFMSLAIKPLIAYSSFSILFYRIFFAGLVGLVAFVIFRRKSLLNTRKKYAELIKKDKQKFWLYTISGTIFLMFNWLLFIYVVNNINVQTASFALFMAPIITALLAYILLKERISGIKKAAIFISFIACVSYYMAQHGDILFALLTALCYSIYMITQKQNNYLPKDFIVVIQMVLMLILITPYFFLADFQLPSEISFYGWTMILGIVFTLLTLYLNLYALQGIPASTVGILLYISPIITFILAITYFKETVNSLQILSYLLILLAVVLFNYTSIRKISNL